MAGQTHRIGELRFRLRAPDAVVADAWCRAVEGFSESRLLPLIEAAFDDLAPDKVLVLDRLDLDLGALGADPMALIPALQAALEAALARLRAPSAVLGPANPDAYPEALIAEFVQKGGVALPEPAIALQAAWAEVAKLPSHRLSQVLACLALLCGDARAARRLVTTAPPNLLRAMARALAGQPDGDTPSASRSPAPEGPVLAALRSLAVSPSDSMAAAALVAALDGAVATQPVPPEHPAGSVLERPAPLPEPPVAPPQAKAVEPLPLAVPAAGLVLLHPFLATYFDSLGLLAGPGRFAGTHACSLAVRLSQRLATGAETAPEADCVLAKLLCGLKPEEALLPVGLHVPSEQRVAEEADRLLTAVIGHWAKLGRTSPEGLREAFLRRPGLVQRKGDGWLLRVERRGTDVLLDSLPWTIGLVRTPFMTSLLAVDWR
jgi:hypothetical protein